MPRVPERPRAGWIASIIGAVLLLLIYRAIVGRRGTPPA
jgi:uncharacterized membrane protein YeaQ/YmgE (transglycosylase-associated protein family)